MKDCGRAGRINFLVKTPLDGSGSGYLTLQRIFNHTTGDHHRFVFNDYLQFLAYNRITAGDITENRNTELSAVAIALELASLLFYGLSCFTYNVFGQARERDGKITCCHQLLFSLQINGKCTVETGSQVNSSSSAPDPNSPNFPETRQKAQKEILILKR